MSTEKSTVSQKAGKPSNDMQEESSCSETEDLEEDRGFVVYLWGQLMLNVLEFYKDLRNCEDRKKQFQAIIELVTSTTNSFADSSFILTGKEKSLDETSSEDDLEDSLDV